MEPDATVSLSFAVSGLVRQFAQLYRLSGRETNVLVLAAAGLHRKESAFRLGCSPGTVDTYWRRIFRKTGQTCQPELFAALLAFAVGDRTRGEEACRLNPVRTVFNNH
jgi:DNA-binding CsgD family transcriptional regulator